MTDITERTGRIFAINTDSRDFKKSHPNKKHESPFFSHWLPDGNAYLTPNENKNGHGHYQEYDKALSELEVGDLIFAYEDKEGIVALGEVLEKPDLKNYPGGTSLYPDTSCVIKRIRVSWDTSVNLPTSVISANGTVCRGGLPLWQVSSPKLLSLLYSVLEASDIEQRLEKESAALQKILVDESISPKDRLAIDKARIGQGVFRTRVLKIEPRCRITGVSNPRHLRASHIKPWIDCQGAEHISGHNGLMLAPHVDQLFDRGHISFADDGEMKISQDLDRSVLKAWSIPERLNVGAFSREQGIFLEFHRTNVFEKYRRFARTP